MDIFIILIFATILLYIIGEALDKDTSSAQSTSSQRHDREIIVHTLDLPDDERGGTYVAKIASVNHHRYFSDIGVFTGIVFNDYENRHDRNAMAIANMKAQIVGFIPADELTHYNQWSNKQSYPCVGFIKAFTNEEGEEKLYGRVYAIKPCNAAFIERRQHELIQQIKDREF